jgi:serine phosphatase RsbU (regulator of sigma subunit)
MLGIAFLNDVVAQSGIVSPANILERLRTKIKNSLQQTGVAKEAKDGMDMSICVVNTQTQILSYAGANNPVFFIRNNEFEVLSPTKNPVGIYQREVRFAQTELKLMPGDRFYMFTDGFVDQFGGKNGDKLKKHRFVEAILKNHQHPMVEQHQLFQNLFDNWRKDFNQVDDVLLLGFTI